MDSDLKISVEIFPKTAYVDNIRNLSLNPVIENAIYFYVFWNNNSNVL